MHRFFLQNKVIRNKKVLFTKEQVRKIRKVLRLKVGSVVEVFDGLGWLYNVKLLKIKREECVGEIISQNLIHNQKTKITIYQAFPKHAKIKFILQKCTELGVDNIIFFQSDFSQIKVKKISADRTARWGKIVSQSAEQSGRIHVPNIYIENELNLSKILENLKNKHIFLLDQSGIKITELPSNLNLDEVCVFIGPEGGFSKNEILLFEKYKAFKIRVSDNTLRTETAGVAFLSQLYLILS